MFTPTPHFVHCPLQLPSPVTPVATEILTGPTPAGVLHDTDVLDSHKSSAHAVSPTLTVTPGAEADEPKYSPVSVMMVPPAVGPLSGAALCGPKRTQSPSVWPS